MERLNVLQVNKLYFPEVGGIEKTVQQIVEGLAFRSDVNVQVLVCQKKGTGTIETIHGVKVYRCGSLGVVSSVPISFPFLWKFRKMAKEYDIVHFHLPFPLGDLACLLSGYKGKVVVYWHSDVVKQRKWMLLYRPIMELFLKRADIILVGAMGVAKGSKYLTPYLNKCREVPFAVDDDILQTGHESIQRQKDHSLKKSKTTHFLFIGRLVYYKGCSVLLDACSKVKNDFHLSIIGDGILEQELKEQSISLGIENRVSFLGYVSEEQKRRLLEDADVFVLPSVERSEAFALVQLEAMSYGVPVINTNLPSGVPEVSIHEETGLTVEPGDADAFAEAMDWMAEHVIEREKMGIRARKRVEEKYTQQARMESLMKVYRDISGRY